MATDPILKIKDVVAGYGRMIILNHTTFDVQRGAITTVIGPNGAGKSTVFKAVFGMLPVRSGEIVFDGKYITGLMPAELLKLGICYIPQGRNIFPVLDVQTNLRLGGASARLSPTDLKSRVEEALDRFPVLRKKARHQASTLSGGEQKQLEIARGLMLRPKLILIDEPSIGLSPLLVEETFRLIKSLRDKGITILMVEQNAKSALELSDFGIVLELGQMRLSDRASAVLADPQVGQLFLGGTLKTT